MHRLYTMATSILEPRRIRECQAHLFFPVEMSAPCLTVSTYRPQIFCQEWIMEISMDDSVPR
jgi:hypothetical protein